MSFMAPPVLAIALRVWLALSVCLSLWARNP
jgi:hypothetical protein